MHLSRVYLMYVHYQTFVKICIRFYVYIICVAISPVRWQAITWTNAGILSIGLLETKFNEIWIGNLSFVFKKMHLKMSAAKLAAILSQERWVKHMVQNQNKPLQTSHDDAMTWKRFPHY